MYVHTMYSVAEHDFTTIVSNTNYVGSNSCFVNIAIGKHVKAQGYPTSSWEDLTAS